MFSLDFVTGENVDVLLEYSTKLLERFRYPWEMLPLMLVILKDAQADLEEASRRISEGKNNFSSFKGLHMSRRPEK